GRLFPTAVGLLARGQLPTRGRRISGRARVEDLELDARAPSRVEDLEPGHLGPAELVRRWSRSWRRRLPRILSADRASSRARSRRQGPLPLLRRSRPLHPGGRRGGPRRHPPRVTLHRRRRGRRHREGGEECSQVEFACGHSCVERRRDWRRRQGWRGGLLKPSSLRDEASGDAAFLCRWASRPAAGGAAAGVAAISPSLSVKSSSTRHLSVPELEGLVDLVEGGSGREKAPGGSNNNLDRTTNWTSKASDSP
ncbi:unnamed protein product, partial [Urochloa humidicola]